MHPHQRRRQAAMSLACLGYLLFVAYGSLVPLDFRLVSPQRAWELFVGLSVRPGGETTRTDWVANIALGVPIGFLIAQSLARRRMSWPPALAALLLGTVFSAAVEFAQAYFPPRTPSLDDLLAQAIGGALGVLLAAACANWMDRFFHALGEGSRLLPVFLLDIYLAAYLAFALFPYDVLLSGSELAAKMHGTAWGWLAIGARLDSPVLSLLKFLSEIVLTIPLGLYAGHRAGDRSPAAAVRRAVALGGALGLFIEIAQFFIFSGISEGLSVLTRAAGAGLGALAWQRRRDGSWTVLAGRIRRHAPWLGLAYLAVLLQTNGWLTAQWSGPSAAAAKLAELRFIPFYYHYFTTEAKALFSLAVVCLAYAPVGILFWARGGKSHHAALGASLAAAVIEGGKLFLPGRHPDPSNVIFAAAAACAACALAGHLSRIRAASARTAIDAPGAPAADAASAPRGANADQTAYALPAAALAFSGYWAITFPAQPAALFLFLCGAAAAVWWRPILFVPVVLAALPALDLAQWSGRLFLDEFDLLLLTGLAVAHARVPRAAPGARGPDPVFALAGGLLLASFTIGCARGLFPWQPIDADSFIGYYSPFNALRIAKGALWAWLCYGLLRRMARAGLDVRRPLVIGMLAGLALTVAVILWERATFSGPFNFSSDYRVTGPFSQMHVGGAYIECYLAVAVPFLTLFILDTRSWLARAAGLLLLLAATYALMVTFSRNGYAAFGIGVCGVLFFAVLRAGGRVRSGLSAIALAGAVVAAALPILAGEFPQKRLAAAAGDFELRRAHWDDALGIRAPGWPTRLFGMGLGRFPESHYLFSGEGKRPGSYQLRTEGPNTYLRLIPGESIFLGQRVRVVPHDRYLLKFDVRANRPGATITVPICEKWLLSSYGCLWVERKTGDPAGGWQHFEVPLVADQLMKAGRWYLQRPVKLALHNGNAGAVVDIDNVALETAGGNDLIANGDFSRSLDHWLFTVDNHAPWHVDNLFIHMLFETGWLGLLALGAFSLLALWRAAASACRGDMNAACLLSAFTAYIVMGVFNSPIDSPRFLFLYLLLGALCAKSPPEHTHR